MTSLQITAALISICAVVPLIILWPFKRKPKTELRPRRYRIAEYDGKFTIQTSRLETTGMLWWRKTEEVWIRTNSWGGQMIYGHVTTACSPIFDSLEAARNQIAVWGKGVIYHDVPPPSFSIGVPYSREKLQSLTGEITNTSLKTTTNHE